MLLPHSGPHQFSDGFFDTDAQFLASRSYAVLQVNFSGSSGRGGLFESAGFKHDGLKVMDDLMDSVKWADAVTEIDGSRVCVYDEGFDAYATLMRHQSPAMLANEITVPVMLIKSVRDDVSVPNQAESMRDALTKAGPAPEWFVEKEGKRGNVDPKRRQAFYERLAAFLGKHLAQ